MPPANDPKAGAKAEGKANAKPKQSGMGKQSSVVEAVDKSGNVFKGFNIWTDIAPAAKADLDLLYAKALVLPGSTRENLKCKQVEPMDESAAEFVVPQQHAFNCNTQIDPMTYPDIGSIPHTNPPCVLDFLKQRFIKGQIYTTADPLLVAINPFKDLGNTTDTIIKQYRDAGDPTKMPPHVFSIAREALENLHQLHKSQTIIVSGESGAGKTEATKQIMRYFAAAKSGAIDTRIQTAVLAANPVLEAFGNAKTIRNNNSSRFGRFMQLQVAGGGGIEFGSVRNFLLEKSRIVTQEGEERGYHIFYQFLKGASSDQKSKYKLKGLNEYKFINPQCTDAPGINDLEEWADVNKSFVSMQRTPEEINGIMSIIAGVLLMGNVVIKGGETAAIDNKSVFEEACNLMFLDPKGVEEGISVKVSSAGAETVKGTWSEKDAEILKLSLAKAMYDKLFDWVIVRLNKNIEPPSGFNYFMGMLDIFGFEVFKQNSLEQLFINITNEMLQKNFIDVVFERETKLYREEGISAADLEWTTNAPVIEMLTGKKTSLMSILEDQCLAPGSADEKFLSGAYAGLKGNEILQPAKVASNINFVILHTIGPIQYNCQGFLVKNKDILRAELVEVAQASSNPVTKALFEGVVVERGKLAKGQLIGSQFLRQLTGLMELINSTEPHFIRCVKPNEEKKALVFTNSKVLIQLRALSILEALELRNLGYSYRRPFSEFLFQFRFVDLGIAENKSQDPRDGAQKLLEKGQIDKKDFQIGKTMVFLKPQAMKDMARKQREAMSAWEPLVTVIEAMILKKSIQERLNETMPSLTRFQAHVRRRLQA